MKRFAIGLCTFLCYIAFLLIGFVAGIAASIFYGSTMKKKMAIVILGVAIGAVIAYFLNQWIFDMAQDKVGIYEMRTASPWVMVIIGIVLLILIAVGYLIERRLDA